MLGLSGLLKDSPFFNPTSYGGWNRDYVREVDVVSGSFLLVEHELWKALGGFDKAFFMYAEEIDLCYRARRLGARPVFTPDATIIHYGGASERMCSDRAIKRLTGQVHFLRKHWPSPKLDIAIGLLKLRVFSRMLGYGLLGSLVRREKYRVTAEEWRTIWFARDRWAAGYSRTGR